MRSPGLRSCLAASPSPTLTLPARTSACARLRVSTRPRSTSSWSSRTRWTRGLAVDAALTRLSWHSALHPDSRPRRARSAGGDLRAAGRGTQCLDRLAHLGGQAVGVEAEQVPQVGHGTVINE